MSVTLCVAGAGGRMYAALLVSFDTVSSNSDLITCAFAFSGAVQNDMEDQPSSRFPRDNMFRGGHTINHEYGFVGMVAADVGGVACR